MKTSHMLMTTLVCLSTALSALAGFTPPSEARIDAAAGNPTQLTALLRGASLEEAAHVLKTVMARIASLNLSAQEMESRINLAIRTTLTALPAGGRLAFCAMLGNEMGNSMGIRNNTALVSSAQGALTTFMGTEGTAAAEAFGKAFTTAASGSSNPQNTKDSNKAQPPSALLYKGQI